MKTSKRHHQGITLIEMLLVAAILGGVMYVIAGYMQQKATQTRLDRASGQMQQILNAGMAYYVSNNKWPATGSINGTNELQTSGYLPTNMTSPFGSTYVTASSGSVFYVSGGVTMGTATAAASFAKTIAGTLPLGFTANTSGAIVASTCTGTTCYAVGSVNVPSQSLSGASSVNFAGIYHNGACVPAPTCPTNYTGQIFAVPVGVNAFYSAPGNTSPDATCSATNTAGCLMTYIQLSGFTAYATEEAAAGPYSSSSSTTKPLDCGTTATTRGNCYVDDLDSTQVADGTSYWRVCLAVTTSSGDVVPSGSFANPWGQLSGSIMVMTRCKSNTENYGSGFYVWEPTQ